MTSPQHPSASTITRQFARVRDRSYFEIVDPCDTVRRLRGNLPVTQAMARFFVCSQVLTVGLVLVSTMGVDGAYSLFDITRRNRRTASVPVDSFGRHRSIIAHQVSQEAWRSTWRRGAESRGGNNVATTIGNIPINHNNNTRTNSSSNVKRVASLLQWAKDIANIKIAPGAMELGLTMAAEVSSLIKPVKSMSGSTSAGLGWTAIKDLSVNDVLVQVPQKIALSVEIPGEGPDDRDILNRYLPLSSTDRRKFLLNGSQNSSSSPSSVSFPWFVTMALYLHKLRRIDGTKKVSGPKETDVSYGPWIETLPLQLDTPIHWQNSDPEAIDALQYEFMKRAIQRQEIEWRHYHQQVTDLAKSLPLSSPYALWSWDDFLWACETARSRAFSSNFSGSTFNPAIYAFTLILVAIYVSMDLGTWEQAANGAGVVLSVSVLQNFVIPRLFKKQRYVICPLIDMSNHNGQDNGAAGKVALEYFGDVYSLSLLDSVSRGSQIYISYGTRSNDQLLQYYGFVESNNPHDVYIMPPLRNWDITALEMVCQKERGRSFASGRLAKLDRAGLLGGVALNDVDSGYHNKSFDANREGGVVLSRAEFLDPAVLQALRALVSTDAEWDAAGQSVGSFVDVGSGGPENEACARLVARTAVINELASKPTTIEEDQDLLRKLVSLESLGASTADKLAVQFRIEKKRVLIETIENLS